MKMLPKGQEEPSEEESDTTLNGHFSKPSRGTVGKSSKKSERICPESIIWRHRQH
jgi:hypothetical protein